MSHRSVYRTLGTVGILLAVAALSPLRSFAQAPSLGQVFDGDIRMVETDVVRLAQAMPADKYEFAPSAGEFKGVRTFAQQMTHIAANNYAVSSAVLEEPNPSVMGDDENGPPSIKGKEAVLKYLKDSYAYAHKAAATLTTANAMDRVPSPFGPGKVARVSMVSFVAWHSLDHYGQAVVYARMNGIVPPASQPQPPPK